MLGGDRKKSYFCTHKTKTSRGGAVVARWAHNPKVAGSSPAPATKSKRLCHRAQPLLLFCNCFVTFADGELFHGRSCYGVMSLT